MERLTSEVADNTFAISAVWGMLQHCLFYNVVDHGHQTSRGQSRISIGFKHQQDSDGSMLGAVCVAEPVEGNVGFLGTPEGTALADGIVLHHEEKSAESAAN